MNRQQRRLQANIRRLKILAYIGKHTVEEGYPPTIREIADAVGLRSTSSVWEHVKRLEEAGLVARKPFKIRTLHLEKKL